MAVAALATGVRIAGFPARVDSAFATARRLDIARAELLVLAAAGAIGMIATPLTPDALLSDLRRGRGHLAPRQLQTLLANIIPGRRGQDRIGNHAYGPLALMLARQQVAGDDRVTDVQYRCQGP